MATFPDGTSAQRPRCAYNSSLEVAGKSRLLISRYTTEPATTLQSIISKLYIRPAQNFRGKKCETPRRTLGQTVTAHQF